MLNETDITFIVGQRGCGKSFLGRSLSGIYPRRFVFDRIHEWEPAQNPGQVTVSNFPDFSREYERLIDRDEFLLVFQPTYGLSTEEFDALSNAILRVLFLAEKTRLSGLAILFEEVQFYAPSHSMLEWFTETIHTGRHSRLAVIASSQRPASVHKSLISLSANFFIGQLWEPNDIKYLSSGVGEIAEQARNLKPRQFIYYKVGSQPIVITTETM